MQPSLADSPPPAPDAPARVGAVAGRALPWLGPATILVLGCALLAWTWLAWSDLLVDFGRELYVAWQLAEGRTLYEDVAYFNGPLSPYVNALWFRVFGPSILTLVVANLGILALTTVLLYRLFSVAADRLSAAVACLVFLSLFGFAHLTAMGNYNFLTPYSHEMTHGIALGLASLACATAYARRGRPVWLAGAGFALGLLFLTKVEVFLAGAAAAGGAVIIALWSERASPARWSRRLLTFVGSAVLAPTLAWLLLAAAMPSRLALDALLQTYVVPLDSGILSLPFYRLGMGIDDVPAGLGKMAAALGWTLLLLGPVAVLDLAIRRPTRRVKWIAAAMLLFGATLPLSRAHDWLEAPRALPLVMLLLLVVAVLGFVRRGRTSVESAGVHVSRIGLLLFALTLLGKMLLNARIYHYGFALAMPATLVLTVALVRWIPERLQRFGGRGVVFGSAALGVLLAAIASYLAVTGFQLERKEYAVGRGSDLVRADSLRGPVVARLLDEIDRQLLPNQTLVVFPEGVMLNYLARRRNPTPYINFLPPELLIFREDRILAALEQNPPDAVALVHRDASEYGSPFFGVDYGQSLAQWIDAHFCTVFRMGGQPLRADTRFGVELRLRCPASGAPMRNMGSPSGTAS